MTNDDALYWKNRALKAEDRVREACEIMLDWIPIHDDMEDVCYLEGIGPTADLTDDIKRRANIFIDTPRP